jgi:hypothetical protein
LADYEIYRNKIQNTPRCLEAFKYANDTKCIISYERNFLKPVFEELLTRQNCFTNYVFFARVITTFKNRLTNAIEYISINYNVYGTGIVLLLQHFVDFTIIVRLAGLKAYLKMGFK